MRWEKAILRHRGSCILALLLLVFSSFFTPGGRQETWEPQAADVYLGISSPGAKKIHMAVLGFGNALEGPKRENLTALVLKTLRTDMDLSEAISVVEPTALPFEAAKVKMGEEKEFLPRLSSLQIQVGLVGELSRKGDKLIIEAKLHDVSAGHQIFHNRYVGDDKSLKGAVHRLSDDIIYYLTGEKGISRTKLAFVSDRTGAKEIYVMDPDGDNLMQMTGNRSLNLTPRWSPTGRFLAYVSYRDDNPDLFLLDVTSGKRGKISSFRGLNISPSWAPDGKSIALALSKKGSTNIYVMRSDGTGLHQLTNGRSICVSPSWSPNGRQLAFVSDEGGNPQIYVMDAEGTNVRRITFKGNYNTSPAWSPRGDKIAYVSRLNGSFEICIMSPDGSKTKALTQGAGDNESPSWSPDGRYIAFSSTRGGRSAIFVMREDGSGERRVSPSGAEYFTPDWSPR